MKRTAILLIFLLHTVLSGFSQDLTILDGTSSFTILPTSFKASRSLLTNAQNLAIGIGALTGNNHGNYNTAIGFNAGFGTTGSGNVFIGHNAGHSYVSDDILIIRGRYGANGLLFGNFQSFMMGINTDSPQANFHINAPDSLAVLRLTNTFTSHSGGLKVAMNKQYASIRNEQSGGVLSLGTNIADVFNINSLGKVGINVLNPQADLEVHSSAVAPGFTSIRLINNTTESTGFHLSSLNANAYIINQTPDGNLGFYTEGRESMVISAQNRVGIGTNLPASKLEIMHNSDLTSAHLELNEQQYDYARIRLKNINSAFTNQYWDIAATVDDLSTSSTGDQLNFYLNGKGDVFQLRGNGSACLNGNLVTTGTTCTSDIRYKRNFTPLTNTLEKITHMRGLYYFWKTEEFREKVFAPERQIGFIAQEVEVIFPELVLTDADGYKSVDYARLTPVLVEAIKELKLRNELLEQKLNKIERMLSADKLQAKN